MFRAATRRADRAARPRPAGRQAGAQPLAGRADEGRDRQLAAAPSGVLFLDEPTLGLDVTMQKPHPGFLAEYNRRHGADRAADQPLHGRRRGAVQAGDRDPPRADPVRRRPARRSPTGSRGTRPSIVHLLDETVGRPLVLRRGQSTRAAATCLAAGARETTPRASPRACSRTRRGST